MKSIYKTAVLLLVLTSCNSREKVSTNEVAAVNSDPTRVTLTEEQFAHANIKIGYAEERTISGVIRANGMLDVPPQNLVTVAAPLQGFVKATELLQGMKVQRGQVMVTLEHPDYIQLQQDYLESKSQMEYLQLDYQRQQELARENVNAAKALQLSKSNFYSMRAKVQGLEAKLGLLNIDPAELENGSIKSTIRLYAPITGYITQVNVNVGMHVNPADVMFRITDNSHLHAEAQVFEKDVARLKVGQHVRFTLAQDTRERTAKVYLIGKEITSERTVRVHCHLDQEDISLIPGMYFSAVIETEQQKTMTVPEAAVVNFDNKQYLFVGQKDNKLQYQMVEVKKGNTEKGFTEIVLPDGVTTETPIAVSGAYELLSYLKNRGE